MHTKQALNINTLKAVFPDPSLKVFCAVKSAKISENWGYQYILHYFNISPLLVFLSMAYAIRIWKTNTLDTSCTMICLWKFVIFSKKDKKQNYLSAFSPLLLQTEQIVLFSNFVLVSIAILNISISCLQMCMWEVWNTSKIIGILSEFYSFTWMRIQ